MKKFVCFILCGVLSIAGLPLYVQATEPTKNEVSLEAFTNQLSAMIDEYDNNVHSEEAPVNSINTFSVCGDETEEASATSGNSTDRLIVKAEGEIDTLDAVDYIEGYNDLHILQFDNGESAEEALEYYKNCDGVEYVQEDEINTVIPYEVEETASTLELPQEMTDDANTLGFTALRRKLQDSNTTYSQQLTVAVIDTGIAYDHDLLKNRVDPNGYDAVNGINGYDDHGHGTHVAGIIVANTLENVTIKSYKVLNCEGKGTDAQTVLGVEAAIADGVDVINMSFGRQGENPAMDEALAKAHNAGIKLVAAAGNDGINMDNIPCTPACCDNVITVMAYNVYMNERMSFSNYGSMCETAAIGEVVLSSYLNNTYAYASGTSQAAPYVSAAVTYLVLDEPHITFDEIVEKIDKFECLNGMYLEYILDKNVPQVSAPTFSAQSGDFDEEFELEIYCSESEFIYYNLSTWSSSTLFMQYNEPIKIKYDTVVTAYAEKKGCISSEKSTVTFTRNFLDEESKYVISSKGEITQYLGGDSEGNTQLIVPDTINGIAPTKIGKNVFDGFGYLENVVLPDSITNIDDYAFRKCVNLEYITARGVTNAGSYSFYKCNSLKEFICSSLETIGTGAFSGTSSLTYLDTRNVTTIGSSAFESSTGIQSIASDKITSIGTSAFAESSLRNADLPSVTGLSSSVFSNCKNLEAISIPNATIIYADACYGCDSLKEISADKLTLIRDNAFSRCTSLVSVDLPVLKTVTLNAFYGCSALKNFHAPLLNTVGISAFENCTMLEAANYQYTEVLSDYAFKGCTSLKNVNLPALKTLGTDAFAGCSSLNEVWIKGDVTVNEGAFENDFTADKVILDNAVSIKDLPENIPTAIPSSITAIEDTDFENVIIYGTKGSYAESWATENNQTFIELTADNAVFNDVSESLKNINDTLSFDVMGFNRVYQWYGNTKNSNTGGKFIKNATSSEFIPSNYSKLYDYYYCVVICQDGSNPLMNVTSGVCAFTPSITALTSETAIKFDEQLILTSATGTRNITKLLQLREDALLSPIPSLSLNGIAYYGTGSSVVVYADGQTDSVFNLIVYGDVNGDSICDAIDCADVEKAANGHTTLNNSYSLAADMDSNSKLNVKDYQAIVNKSLAE